MLFRQASIAFALWALAAPAFGQDVANPTLPNSVNGAYNASAPTCTDGHGCWIQTDINGKLITVVGSSPSAAAAATIISTAALASNLVVKATPGNLYSFEVQADSTLYAAIWYVIIFDATSLPSNGAVTPAKCYTVPAATASLSGTFPVPVAFTTGITIGVSTTGCFTQTASVHAFISGDFK